MELLATLVILLLIIAAYWSLVVLPKQQDFKKQQMFVRRVRPGDRIVTYGGLIGTVLEINPDMGVARIRLADGVEVEIITAALTQPFNPDLLARDARIGLPDKFELPDER